MSPYKQRQEVDYWLHLLDAFIREEESYASVLAQLSAGIRKAGARAERRGRLAPCARHC
jgi:hypothetical protein